MNETTPAVADRASVQSRTIHVGDGVEWLRKSTLGPTHAVVTSMPDVSEVKPMGFKAWRAWFIDTAALVCEKVAEGAVAVFYQTDIQHGDAWIDKGFLVASGAERAGAACLFHKIVCRVPAGSTTFGRPAYAHLMAFSRGLKIVRSEASADVLPELGQMPWSHAMGTAACEAACRFLLHSTACRVVVDPFCGVGTMLAVANDYGLGAIGVELQEKRARKARRLEFRRGAGIR